MISEELRKKILNCCHTVAKSLAPGFLEVIYKKALILELQANGLKVDVEKAFTVVYRNVELGEFRADLIVEDKVIIELKATSSISIQHEVQLVNYLHVTGLQMGYIINFGEYPLGIKRKDLNYISRR